MQKKNVKSYSIISVVEWKELTKYVKTIFKYKNLHNA